MRCSRVASPGTFRENRLRLGRMARIVERSALSAAKSPDIAQFYPGESRKKRESGDVDLQICAGPDGVLVGDPKILRSSGHERLDEAASAWVRAAKWVPATSNRRAVEGCAEVTARFRS